MTGDKIRLENFNRDWVLKNLILFKSVNSKFLTAATLFRVEVTNKKDSKLGLFSIRESQYERREKYMDESIYLKENYIFYKYMFILVIPTKG